MITGKAYGQGTYFAPDAIKSLGYTTSKADAKYGGGHESTGFMAIYKVATGNRYDGKKAYGSVKLPYAFFFSVFVKLLPK